MGSAAFTRFGSISAVAAAAKIALLIIFPSRCGFVAAHYSEIGFKHLGVIAHRLRVASGYEPSFGEHIDKVALSQHDPHLVIDEEHGDALGAKRVQMLDDAVLKPRIDARERLVRPE